MGIMLRASQDLQTILGNKNEFALDLVFTAETGQVLQTTGLFFDRSIQYSIENSDITGNTVVVHVAIKPFTDAGYPIYDANGLVSVHGHLVLGTYADGTQKQFKVFSFDPDYSLNMATIYLDHYVDN